MRRSIIAMFAATSALVCAPAFAQVATTADSRGNTTVRDVNDPAQPGRTFDIVDGTNGPIAIWRGSHLFAHTPLTVPPEFSDQGDVLVHAATGIRLPKVHNGCRLVALEPSQDHAGAPFSFAAGAVADYDCLPSESLTYVVVAFRGGATLLKEHDLAYALPRLANAAVQLDLHASNDQCRNMVAPPQSPLAGFSLAQCGGRWKSTGDPKSRLYGTAAMAIGRGAGFIVFSNSCVDAQCDTNRPEFGKFIFSFDLSGLHDPADAPTSTATP